jgi:hypothetical protein
MVFKVNCGIRVPTVILGSLFIKNNNFNFIKFTRNITNKNNIKLFFFL